MKLTDITPYLLSGEYTAVYQNGDLTLISTLTGITRYSREDNYMASELAAECNRFLSDAFTVKDTIFDIDGDTPIREDVNSDNDNFVVSDGTYTLELDVGDSITLTNSDGNRVYSRRADGFFYTMEWDGITLVQEWDSTGTVREYTNYDGVNGEWISIEEWDDNSNDTLTRMVYL